jgi:hypothetical protein
MRKDFEVGNNVPYDPRKAHALDMLALDMAEERWPDANILVVNRHGYGVCGTQVPNARETVTVRIPV